MLDIIDEQRAAYLAHIPERDAEQVSGVFASETSDLLLRQMLAQLDGQSADPAVPAAATAVAEPAEAGLAGSSVGAAWPALAPNAER